MKLQLMIMARVDLLLHDLVRANVILLLGALHVYLPARDASYPHCLPLTRMWRGADYQREGPGDAQHAHDNASDRGWQRTQRKGL